MVEVREVIVVEGRYDKNHLSQIVRAPIVETEGFGLFNDPEKRAFLRKLAAARGLIVFTDADSAGFLIRNHLRGFLPREQIKHAYLPDIYGKEKRKKTPGREGKIGVEGAPPAVIVDALRRAGATIRALPDSTNLDAQSTDNDAWTQATPADAPLTKADFYVWGLSGHGYSDALRRYLKKALNLPEHLSANGMLWALPLLIDRETLNRLVEEGKTALAVEA